MGGPKKRKITGHSGRDGIGGQESHDVCDRATFELTLRQRREGMGKIA